jgi:hypothetical protein
MKRDPLVKHICIMSLTVLCLRHECHRPRPNVTCASHDGVNQGETPNVSRPCYFHVEKHKIKSFRKRSQQLLKISQHLYNANVVLLAAAFFY